MAASVDRLDICQFTFLAFSAMIINWKHTQLTKYATDFIPCAISAMEGSSEGRWKPDSCGALEMLANWVQRTTTSSKKAVQVEMYLKNDKTATQLYFGSLSLSWEMVFIYDKANVAEMKLYRQCCSLKRSFLSCRNTNNNGS